MVHDVLADLYIILQHLRGIISVLVAKFVTSIVAWDEICELSEVQVTWILLVVEQTLHHGGDKENCEQQHPTGSVSAGPVLVS